MPPRIRASLLLVAGIGPLVAMSAGCSSATIEEAPETPLSSPSTPEEPPPLPRAEAGFLDIPHANAGRAGHARIFYSFHAADEAPLEKPLLVFFNGGPGSATSRTLLPFGTGRVTIDTHRPPADCLVANPRSFTRFANLLYLDERDVGFSYSAEETGGDTFDPLADAADFLRAILAFAKRYPAASKAGLGLVAESYGGTRATWITHFLLHPTAERASKLGLTTVVEQYLDQVLPAVPPGTRQPEDVAQHLVGNVLVQPLVLGRFQISAQGEPPVAQGLSPYDIRYSWEGLHELLDRRAFAVLASREQRERLLEVPTLSIRKLLPEARPQGVRHLPSGARQSAEDYGEHEIHDALSKELGSLGPGDRYYASYVDRAYISNDVESAMTFLLDLPYVPTFITQATYDRVIVSTAIVRALEMVTGIEPTVDDSPRPAVPRPGWISVALQKIRTTAPRTATIRFPTYESGHTVTTTMGGELSDDVKAWLEERRGAPSR